MRGRESVLTFSKNFGAKMNAIDDFGVSPLAAFCYMAWSEERSLDSEILNLAKLNKADFGILDHVSFF